MEQLLNNRLANQGLYPPRFNSAAESLTRLGAIQGQDYNGAKWSLGLRVPGSSDAIIEQAIADQAIVRTWAMRGTLHFVAAEDLQWLLALLGPRIITTNGRRYKQLELDSGTLARADEILVAALADGRHLNRQELRPFLENAGISTAGQRMVYMLQHASLNGRICQETAPKNKPLFTLAPRQKEPQRLFDRPNALAELALRYFTTRGPAALDDFVWWSGLLVADARAGLEGAAPELVREKEGGKEYWLPKSPSPLPDSLPEIMLLPGFDEYLVSYRDRSAVIADAHYPAWSRTNAMFSPTILLRGQVKGFWKREIKRGEVTVIPELFNDLTEDETAALEEAALEFTHWFNFNPR
ncbi:MAG: winged helix DNA-binding domain-containing protein [Candidatus Promineifilaceae bacterium]|jgi:hypothetical protein